MTVPHNSHGYAPVAVPVAGGGDSNLVLGESFIAAVPVDGPSAGAEAYLEVVAPATLPEGYEFEAETNGHQFTVKVPVGGVEQGQKFSVPFPAGANGYSGSAVPRASVPVGHWRDGLCDCFVHGPIHPAIWNAWCCPLILAGQVMTRLKLTWLGNEGSIAQTAPTFRILFMITVGTIALIYLLAYATPEDLGEHGVPTDTFWTMFLLRLLLQTAFGWFTICIVARTRGRIRSRYGIPTKSCGGCEDCCCSIWCTCCTVAQMARHTADYHTYAGLCCSETGGPPHAPSIV